MKNYCCFTNYIEDKLSSDIFNYMSNDKLQSVLDDYFYELDINLSIFSQTFKTIFNGLDYDEYYYQALSLIEALNDIKIIINILVKRKKDE